ncbi:hypothetical protein BH10BAC3_BH10BAC3_36370 [soil metagenome]
MPTIKAIDFTARGWKEHYSGFPADVYYAGDGSDSPWKEKPHLHLNYAIGGELKSLTHKDTFGMNVYLYINGEWQASNLLKLYFSPLKAEIAFVKGLQ